MARTHPCTSPSAVGCTRPRPRVRLSYTPAIMCRAQSSADVVADVGALPVLGFSNDDVCISESGSPRTLHDGYLQQLREAAMALHTKEQLGKKPSNGSEQKRPEPTLVGYLRFLQESKVVWDCIEDTVAQSDDPNLVPFKTTGLERGPALQKDIQWFDDIQSLGPLPVTPDGPGAEYAQLLRNLAEDDVPAFLCHYYNIVFAHNAGGMMIGKILAKKLLDGTTLEFYKYDADVKELGAVVKADLDKVAASWTDEERQRSVDQTKNSFKYAGSLMKCITQSE